MDSSSDMIAAKLYAHTFSPYVAEFLTPTRLVKCALLYRKCGAHYEVMDEFCTVICEKISCSDRQLVVLRIFVVVFHD